MDLQIFFGESIDKIARDIQTITTIYQTRYLSNSVNHSFQTELVEVGISRNIILINYRGI